MDKKEQTVCKVNEAITVMDYTESEDAVLYPLSAGALHCLPGRGEKKRLVSFFRRLYLFDHLSSSIEFFFYPFLLMCFGVDRLSEMSR